MDERILKESELRDRKDAILDDRKSQKSGGAPRAASQKPGPTQDLETKSVASSHMSGASKLSRGGPKKDTTAAKDNKQ